MEEKVKRANQDHSVLLESREVTESKEAPVSKVIRVIQDLKETLDLQVSNRTLHNVTKSEMALAFFVCKLGIRS